MSTNLPAICGFFNSHFFHLFILSSRRLYFFPLPKFETSLLHFKSRRPRFHKDQVVIFGRFPSEKKSDCQSSWKLFFYPRKLPNTLYVHVPFALNSQRSKHSQQNVAFSPQGFPFFECVEPSKVLGQCALFLFLSFHRERTSEKFATKMMDEDGASLVTSSVKNFTFLPTKTRENKIFTEVLLANF